MTHEQERHLASIKNRFSLLVDKKYRQGQTEHGGNMWEHGPLWAIDQAIEECLDQFTYLCDARDGIVELLEAKSKAAA